MAFSPEAQFVHGIGRNMHGDAGPHRDLSPWVRTVSGLPRLAEDNLANLFRRYPRPL